MVRKWAKSTQSEEPTRETSPFRAVLAHWMLAMNGDCQWLGAFRPLRCHRWHWTVPKWAISAHSDEADLDMSAFKVVIWPIVGFALCWSRSGFGRARI